MSAGVLFVEASRSHKLAPVDYEPYYHAASGRTFKRPHPRAPFVASTYTSIAATCPTECPMKDAGCYAQLGFTARAVRHLDSDAGAGGMTGLDVIKAEAAAIGRSFHGGRVPQDGARGGRDLRLHVAGDVPTDGTAAAARVLAHAARHFRLRGGGAVFTYTHQWRRVARSSWGGISVLASCDKPSEVPEARRRGYAAALVVAGFPGDRAFKVPGIRGRVIPCPAQTRGTTCAECRLCLDRDLLGLEVTVAFAAHGVRLSQIAKRSYLPVVA